MTADGLVVSPGSDFYQLLDAAPDAMLVVDRRGHVTAANVEAARFFGSTETELIGRSMSRLMPTRVERLLDRGVTDHRASVANASGTDPIVCVALRDDGTEFPVELSRRLLGDGREAHSLVTVRDYSQWSRSDRPNSRNSEQARAVLQSIGDSVITTDLTLRVTYLNTVAERLTGWSTGEARGQPLETVLPLVSEVDRQPIANTAARCLEEGRSVDLEDGVLLVRRDGSEIPVGDSAAPVRDRVGAIVGVVLVIQDEGEKRRVGHRLSFEATHDALTGLVNRQEFERRLARVVSGLTDVAQDQVLICLDLDRFKLVNDSCGHGAGDALLRALTPLLSGRLRTSDTLARLGGDEFGILLENCPIAEAQRIAEAIRAALEAFRFEWTGTAFTATASIGLMPLTAEHDSVDSVLRAADAACYAAKEAGGNRAHVEGCAEDAIDMFTARASRIRQMSQAIEDGRLTLFAQPMVALQPDCATRPRFEVLLRLAGEDGTMQPAADFLPQAARYNLMPAIDRWVIGEALAVLGRWRQSHPHLEQPICSINLSAATLADDSVALVLEQELDRCAVRADSICFEVAESAAFVDIARTMRFLAAIRSIGCGMALEDPGGGVTSFTYLKSLPVDFLKIGGALVANVVHDPISGSIAAAVDRIGRSTGMFTVAKQVSTRPILEKIRSLGIGYAQGYAVASPAPLIGADGQANLPYASVAA